MFLFELFMMFLGMVITTIFQEPINNIIAWFQKQLRKLFYSGSKAHYADTSNFILGGRTTNIVIIDGDGHKTFSDKNVRVHVTGELPYELTDDLARLRENTVRDLEARKERGETVPWNGSVLSVNSFSVSRTADYEDYAIDLHLSRCDYYTVYTAIHNLDTGNPSLRERFIDPYTFENNTPYNLPNAIGLCMCVRTRDNKVIFAVRSNSSGFRPGESDVSVVEGINPQYDLSGGTMHISSAFIRAVHEEIGDIDENRLSVSILGFVFDKEYNQWNIIGDAYVNMTQDDIIARRNSGASGRWELKTLDFVSFTPKEIIQYLSTHTMWDMGFITVYFSLVHNGYSRASIEKCVSKYLP